jgi:lipopolysaccharide export system protein LptA
MMALRTRLSAATALLILVALAVTEARSALPAGTSALDTHAPIAVNADDVLADLNGQTLLYTGNVIVTQGMTRLHADRVKVSSSGGKASRVEADGHVVVDTPSGQAMGDSGVYDVAEQVLRLTGNVVLTKDANVMRGGALEVSMTTGMARLTPVPGQSQGRVQGLFVPKNAAAALPPIPGAPPQPRGKPQKP